jgi:hypothetical protein
VDAASARSAGKKQARCSNFLVGSPSLRTDIIYVEMACLGKEEEISDYAPEVVLRTVEARPSVRRRIWETYTRLSVSFLICQIVKTV